MYETFSEIIEDSIQFFKQNWKTLITIILCYLRIFLCSGFSRSEFLMRNSTLEHTFQKENGHMISLKYFLAMGYETLNYLVISLTVYVLI